MKELQWENLFWVGCVLSCVLPIGWMMLVVILTKGFPSKELPVVESEEVRPKLAMVNLVMMAVNVFSGLLDQFGGVSSSAVREGGLERGLNPDNGPQNPPSKN